MFALYIVLSLLFSTLGCYWLKEEGSFTSSAAKRWQASGWLLLGYVFCLLAYAPLRGLFVYLALVSLVGTTLALWPQKAESSN